MLVIGNYGEETGMDTSVTPAGGGDETDEFPGSFGTVGENGSLDIVDFETSGIETSYEPHEWSSFEVVNDDRE